MPRAYIETILSSKPGNRRWYLAMSWGSKVDCRSRGTSDPAGLGGHPLAALPAPAVAGLLRGQMMIHLGIQGPLGQSLLEIIEQPVGVKRRLRVRPGQQLVQQRIRNVGCLASSHGESPSSPS